MIVSICLAYGAVKVRSLGLVPDFMDTALQPERFRQRKARQTLRLKPKVREPYLPSIKKCIYYGYTSYFTLMGPLCPDNPF